MVLSLTVQAASFRVQAPSQVIQGHKFSVTYILENSSETPAAKPVVGEVQNCSLLFGPAMSQSSSYSNINGKESVSSSVGYSYTYRADKAGKVKIAPARITVGGKTYTTAAKALEILPPDRSATTNPNRSVQAYDIDTQTADKPIGGNDLFIRMHLSKPSSYEQEGVVCSMKLYSKYRVRKLANNVQPSYNGFMAEEVQIPLNGKFETVDGDHYYAYEIKRVILFPQKSGKLEITSGSYDVTVEQYETINVPPFGRMRDIVERTLKVESNKAVLDVRPLPLPRPADFIGAVGNFRISAKLTGDKVRTNEASGIKLTISGTGNLKGLTAPEFTFPSQFDLYDPQTDVTATPSGTALSGKVEVNYTFVPQSVGKFSVEGTTCSYFDPAAGEYRQVEIAGFDLNVLKGSSSGTVKFNQEPMRDILPVYKGPLEVSRREPAIVGTWQNLLFYVVFVLGFAVVLVLYRKSLRERANVALMKKKGAGKVANKRLKRAKHFMQKGQKEQFCEEMLTALWGYFSDKLSIPVSELNRDNISKELAEYGVDESVVGRIIGILDECEFSRYARSSGEELSMQEIYSDASLSIGDVENTKRKQK